MATKKKPATRVGTKAKRGRSFIPQDSQSVRFMVIVFTALCIIFAMIAFWQYS